MATTEILASGTTELRSSTITLATGESRTLIMRGGGSLAIHVQASDSSWVPVGGLDAQYPAKQIFGPGVYSVFRYANVGVATAADAAS